MKSCLEEAFFTLLFSLHRSSVFTVQRSCLSLSTFVSSSSSHIFFSSTPTPFPTNLLATGGSRSFQTLPFPHSRERVVFFRFYFIPHFSLLFSPLLFSHFSHFLYSPSHIPLFSIVFLFFLFLCSYFSLFFCSPSLFYHALFSISGLFS